MSNVSCSSNVSGIASLPDLESNPRRPARWRDNSICSDSSEAEEIAAEAMAGAGISLEEWPIPTHSSHRLSPEPDADIEVGLADVSVVDEVSLRAHESVNKQWLISRRNALEGVVERHPLLSMQSAQGYRLLAFWRRPADVDAYEGL